MAVQRTYERGDTVAVVQERPTTTAALVWSPAEIIGLIVGIGFTVLGVAAVAQTGFDTSDIYQPHDVVWGLPHSPLLAVSEIAFGLLMILAAVVPGGMRSLMAFLGAIALGFGIVILAADGATNNMNRWFGVTDRSGWFFVIVGTVVVLAALLSPVIASYYRSSKVEHVAE